MQLFFHHFNPKFENPQNLKQYRSISLISDLQKIMAKILANRLKKILPKVTDYSQSAFIFGRNLLDNVLVTNEIIDELRHKKKSEVLMKVDFEKVYYTVRQEYIKYMLERLGFFRKWVSQILTCLTSTLISILVNESSTN